MDETYDLLGIFPGQYDNPICCAVEMYSLDEGVKYSALSYICGVEESISPVLCNDSTQHVTQNLYDARGIVDFGMSKSRFGSMLSSSTP